MKKDSVKLIVVFMLFVMSLPGCAMILEPKNDGEVFIAPGVLFSIPQWITPERSVEVSQLLSGKFGKQTFQFQARISLNDKRLKIVGVDAIGRRAFDIYWDNNGVNASKASWVPEQVQAENILADIIMVYWPQDIVRDAMAEENLTVKEFLGQRNINQGSGRVVSISYASDRKHAWNETAKLSNTASGYELTIQSSEVTP